MNCRLVRLEVRLEHIPDRGEFVWRSSPKMQGQHRNSIAKKQYNKPRKARKMEAVASTFLRVLSSSGREIYQFEACSRHLATASFIPFDVIVAPDIASTS